MERRSIRIFELRKGFYLDWSTSAVGGDTFLT